MEGIRIRIFGASDCENCKSLMKAFEFHAISYEFIDANDPKHEALCDKHNVDELPHIQAIYEDNEKPFLTNIGYIGPLVFVDKIKKYVEKFGSFLELSKAAASKQINQNEIKIQIEEWKKNGKRCGSCNKKTSS
mgnify:CR=1 FL=1